MNVTFKNIISNTNALFWGLTAIFSGNAYAAQFATQDFFIINSVRVNSGGSDIELLPTLISTALASSTSSITFAGGATFTPTSAFQGKVIDNNLFALENTTIIPGVVSFAENQFFGLLTSSDLDIESETIGIGDSIEITDLTPFLPVDVNVGDVGRMDYTMVQLLTPSNPSIEFGLSPLDVAVSRSFSGLGLIPSLDNKTVAQVFNQPFVVSEGSKGWKYFGKGLFIIGTTAGGALGGGFAGSALPGVGTTAGALYGGGAALLASIGDSIVNNTDGDQTPDPNPPRNLIPKKNKCFRRSLTPKPTNTQNSISSQSFPIDDCISIPEPSSTVSLLALGTLGAASILKRKQNQKSTEKETTKVS